MIDSYSTIQDVIVKVQATLYQQKSPKTLQKEKNEPTRKKKKHSLNQDIAKFKRLQKETQKQCKSAMAQT